MWSNFGQLLIIQLVLPCSSSLAKEEYSKSVFDLKKEKKERVLGVCEGIFLGIFIVIQKKEETKGIIKYN